MHKTRQALNITSSTAAINNSFSISVKQKQQQQQQQQQQHDDAKHTDRQTDRRHMYTHTLTPHQGMASGTVQMCSVK